ncbi:MAG: hypothetical protein EOO51_01855 [Flavobacterium sp.]|nr:MAG: hypothetical protein EOO51_01855 [Flavobacterium sp.]
MSNKITTLVLNLIISGNRIHQEKIAAHLTEILEAQSFDCDSVELEIKKLLMSRMRLFIDAPTQQNKDVLYAVAQFHGTYYPEYAPEQLVSQAA